jgi:hypothetical protein
VVVASAGGSPATNGICAKLSRTRRTVSGGTPGAAIIRREPVPRRLTETHGPSRGEVLSFSHTSASDT